MRGTLESDTHKAPEGFSLRCTLRGHDSWISDLAWSPDGKSIVTCSDDGTVRLWDAREGTSAQTFQKRYMWPVSVAISSDGCTIAVGAQDGSTSTLDIESGRWHKGIPAEKTNYVNCVSWSPVAKRLAVASEDGCIRIIGRNTNDSLKVRHALGRACRRLVWSQDGSMIAFPEYRYITVCDSASGETINTFTSDSGGITDIAWMPDGRMLACCSSDGTIRFWNHSTGAQVGVLEGHTDAIRSISVVGDGRVLASKSSDNTIRLWRCDTWETIAVLREPVRKWDSAGISFHPSSQVLATLGDNDSVVRIWELDVDSMLRSPAVGTTVRYSNAKVVLVGDSGVGKTALAYSLTTRKFRRTESTHGRHVWRFHRESISKSDGRDETREILLWDLAGQPGYRVFHQLHLNEVAVALVLCDAHSETEPFAGVSYWARALDQATHGFPIVKYLVAARTDRGGLRASQARIDEVMRKYGFSAYFQTSAKNGIGVNDLSMSIKRSIPWQSLPFISAPELFRDIRAFLIEQKESGEILLDRNTLIQKYRASRGEKTELADVFDTCLGRFEASGLIKTLTFGDLVLLQPELLDDYCAWVAIAAREEPDGLGCIAERRILDQHFQMDKERRLKQQLAERQMLTATIEEVVGRGIAIRQPTECGDMLVFPSEVRADMPDHPGGYTRDVAFYFEGPVRTVYATLTVSLQHSGAFTRQKLYGNAAVFRGVREQVCGFVIDFPDKSDESLGQLIVFFGQGTEKAVKLLFLRYVNQHLERHSLKGTVRRERVYQCSCGQVISDDIVMRRKGLRKTTVICPVCESHYVIDDLAEESAEQDPHVDELQINSDRELERQTRMAILAERERSSYYHVFLCHNSKDKPQVRQLAQKLRDDGILAWVDENEVLPGDQFVPEIEEAIKNVPVAAVVIGPHSMGPWQEQEWYAFLQRFVQRRDSEGRRLRIIPVLLPGCPNVEDISSFLGSFTYVDFRTGGLDNRVTFQKLLSAILKGNQE